MTNEIRTVICACCERPTDAMQLVADIPTGLMKQLAEFIKSDNVDLSTVVQRALATYLTAVREVDTE